jgi:hypothetical protein
MMPDVDEPVDLGNGRSQVAYLVECRSLPGASGSAVLGFPALVRFDTLQAWIGPPRLLGIDCAHLPRWTHVYERDRATRTGYTVEMNSGISVVIPAWRLHDLLMTPDVTNQRQELERSIRAAVEAGRVTGTNPGDNRT